MAGDGAVRAGGSVKLGMESAVSALQSTAAQAVTAEARQSSSPSQVCALCITFSLLREVELLVNLEGCRLIAPACVYRSICSKAQFSSMLLLLMPKAIS